MKELIEEIKAQIISALNLEEMTPADINGNDQILGDESIDLDSIDDLALIVLMET